MSSSSSSPSQQPSFNGIVSATLEAETVSAIGVQAEKAFDYTRLKRQVSELTQEAQRTVADAVNSVIHIKRISFLSFVFGFLIMMSSSFFLL